MSKINFLKLINWSEFTRIKEGIKATIPAVKFQNLTRNNKLDFGNKDKKHLILEELAQIFDKLFPKISQFDLLESTTNTHLRDQFTIQEFQAIGKIAATINVEEFDYLFYQQIFELKLKSEVTKEKIKALSFPELFFLVRLADGGVLVF